MRRRFLMTSRWKTCALWVRCRRSCCSHSVASARRFPFQILFVGGGTPKHRHGNTAHVTILFGYSLACGRVGRATGGLTIGVIRKRTGHTCHHSVSGSDVCAGLRVVPVVSQAFFPHSFYLTFVFICHACAWSARESLGACCQRSCCCVHLVKAVTMQV